MASRKATARASAAPEKPAKAAGRARPVVLALASLLLLVAFSGEIRDTDIWLHLKTGEHTLATRALTVPDPFSYTSGIAKQRYAGEETTRYFNLTHEWLAQVLMYATYRVAGFPGLVLGRALLLIFFCGAIGWIAFRRTADFPISVAAALSAAGIAIHFQQSRPFLVTFVCLAIAVAILETRRWMWLLPPLFLIWANCHAGFFLGWLVLAAYCAEAAFAKERRLWLVAGACFLASCLNPNGLRVIQILFYYRSSGIQTDLLEWQRPKFWEPGMYSFLLFGSLVVLVLARRRVRAADWVLYFGFAAISLLAVRNTIFMALAGPIVLAAYLPKIRGARSAAALLAAAYLVWNLVPAAAAGDVFALRAAEWQLPSGAADFIQTHRITARMYNPYETGGYLVWRLWPMQRDFIDPRGLSEEAYADYKQILLGRAELLRKYGIEMVVLDGFDYISGQVYPLAVDLANGKDPGWNLVYAAADGFIYMRQPPPGVQPLNAPDALFPSLEAQCDLHLRHDARRPRCARGLAELYAFDGNTDRALQLMDLYLQRKVEPDPEAEQIAASLRVTAMNNRAVALQEQDDLAKAEATFRAAIALAEKTLGPDHPDTAGSLNNLAGLLESKGDYQGAEALYRRALDICERKLGPQDPHTAAALDNLAGLLQATGNNAAAEPLYRRALAIAEKGLGPDHPTTQKIRENLLSLHEPRRQ